MNDEDVKKDLFEKIRAYEVILFLGAGASLEAGYPNGNNLKKSFLKKLSKSEKLLIDENLPLSNFTEEFCRIKDDERKTLNRILYNQFVLRKPKSIKWHKVLSLISHFHTIITTNYDQLLEESYGNKAQILYSSKDIAQKKQGIQTEIYKIHGDPKNFDCIITSSDYNHLFSENKLENIFWSELKSKIINNHVLFIGYSLEDPNINVIFDQIWNELGKNAKTSYFIAPDTPNHKVKHLARNNIKYLNMKASDFLAQLKRDIDKNVVDDFHSKKISSDKLITYSKNQGMLPDLTIVDKTHKVDFFKGIDGPLLTKLNFSFKNNGNFKNEFETFLRGKKDFEKFDITADQILNSEFQFGDIILPKNLKLLRLVPQPIIETLVDIRTSEGVEHENIKVKIFKNDFKAEIQATLKYSLCKIKFDFSETNSLPVKFTYTHNEYCGNLKSEIEEAETLISIFKGNSLKIYPKNLPELEHDNIKNLEFVKHIEQNLKFLKALKEIENLSNCKFSKINFDDLTETNFKVTNTVLKALKKESFEFDYCEEIQLDLIKSKEIENNIIELICEKGYTPILKHEHQKYVVFGNEFDLGIRISQLKDPILINLDAIKKGDTEIAIYRSNSNKMISRFLE